MPLEMHLGCFQQVFVIIYDEDFSLLLVSHLEWIWVVCRGLMNKVDTALRNPPSALFFNYWVFNLIKSRPVSDRYVQV